MLIEGAKEIDRGEKINFKTKITYSLLDSMVFRLNLDPKIKTL